MGALKEYMDGLVGRFASPRDLQGGPFPIVGARLDGAVLMVKVATPDGEREFKAHECFIAKQKDR